MRCSAIHKLNVNLDRDRLPPTFGLESRLNNGQKKTGRSRFFCACDLRTTRSADRPVTLGVQFRHATGAGRGDGLTVNVVGTSPAGEDAFNVRGGGVAFTAALHHQVTVFGFQHAFEQ